MKNEYNGVSSGNLEKVMSMTADKAVELASANSVLGDPITIDGITVIPISKISVGFAGGGADIEDTGKKKNKSPAGAGAKVNVTPMNFITVSDGKVRIVTAESESSSGENIFGIAKGIIDKIKSNKKD